MAVSPIHHLSLAKEPVERIAEDRWMEIEGEVREGLAFGVSRFILDLSNVAEIRALDYWMLLNLAILIPAGEMVVVCAQDQLSDSLKKSRLTRLITCVPHVADAYGHLTGLAAGPIPNNIPIFPGLLNLAEGTA